jgi:hypothetical protein
MPKNLANNFREDLENPSAGLSSDLYTAVEPLISVDEASIGGGHNAARIKYLRENVRKGLVGLEYMTGLKKNKADTFYDEHPAQAVTTDVLKNAPGIGLGVAAGGIGLNYLRQWKNMRRTEGGRMSRAGQPEKDRSSGLNDLLGNAGEKAPKGVDPNTAKIFGDFDGNLLDRVKTLGDMEGGGKQMEYVNKLEAINKLIGDNNDAYQTAMEDFGLRSRGLNGADANAIREERTAFEAAHKMRAEQYSKQKADFVNELMQTDSWKKMQMHADFRRSLEQARSNGGFKSYLGEWLNTAGGPDHPIFSKLRGLAPGQEQAIGDLMERHGLIGGNVDRETIKKILLEHFKNDPSWSKPGGRMDAFIDTTLKRVSNPKHQSSGLLRTLDRVKYPLAMGAGVAVGGSALYQLVKAIQNKVYSSDKTREWKKTLLQSRGDFDQAKKYE